MSDLFDDIKGGVGAILSDIGIKDKHDFTLAINGVEFPVINGKVFRSIDNCVDGCSATILLNKKVRETIKPFGYEEAQVYLGGELVITGLVYAIEPSTAANKKTLGISIYSSACDIVDSVRYPPYEFKKMTLGGIARNIVGNLGLVVDFDSDIEDPLFERVCIDPQQTIFAFLKELADQHGILITSNEKGEVLFIRANTTGRPVETITNVTSAGAKYDGRRLFANYRATARTPARGKKTKILGVQTIKGSKTRQTIKYAEAYDPKILVSRQTIFSADNTSIKDLPQAAEWQRSKRWSEALVIQIPRVGWRPQGSLDLYRENTLVTLKNEDLWLGNGFTFLIKSVEYNLDNKGASSSLVVVPPQAYTGEQIPDIFGLSGDPSNSLESLDIEQWQ